jgi:hypothetical protein
MDIIGQCLVFGHLGELTRPSTPHGGGPLKNGGILSSGYHTIPVRVTSTTSTQGSPASRLVHETRSFSFADLVDILFKAKLAHERTAVVHGLQMGPHPCARFVARGYQTSSVAG